MTNKNPDIKKTTKEKKIGFFNKCKEIFLELKNASWMPQDENATHYGFLKKNIIGLWRIIEISIRGTLTNAIPEKAAALTYYTLMALAPLLMLSLTIFGFVMNVKGEEAADMVKLRLAETMSLFSPNETNDDKTSTQNSQNIITTTKTPASTTDTTPSLNTENGTVEMIAPELQEFANHLIDNTMKNSGHAGVIGLSVLVILAIFMIARIEDAYNAIWNVHSGRPWKKRFINYFLLILLGVSVAALATSMLSIKTILSYTLSASEMASVPFFNGILTTILPTFVTFLALTLLLSILNKCMPNTHVRWIPALIGGAFVAIILLINEKLAVLYVSKISEFNTVYGNLSVILIIMFGMYILWLFFLLGGQLSFSIQNSKYLAKLRKWETFSPKMKEEMFFSCLFLIAAKFYKDEKGPTLEDLSKEIGVPENIVSESIRCLKEMNLIVTISNDKNNDSSVRFHPKTALRNLTFLSIKQTFDNSSSSNSSLSTYEPQGDLKNALNVFLKIFSYHISTDELNKSVENLLDEYYKKENDSTVCS